ncbi:MAG: hypothetical protein IT365_22485 [Candidatus Hydrogenedentes bacterium]|nr:hypothetical protein [Candidatus Hydrogenedentota bacterium]
MRTYIACFLVCGAALGLVTLGPSSEVEGACYVNAFYDCGESDHCYDHCTTEQGCLNLGIVRYYYQIPFAIPAGSGKTGKDGYASIGQVLCELPMTCVWDVPQTHCGSGRRLCDVDEYLTPTTVTGFVTSGADCQG